MKSAANRVHYYDMIKPTTFQALMKDIAEACALLTRRLKQKNWECVSGAVRHVDVSRELFAPQTRCKHAFNSIF